MSNTNSTVFRSKIGSRIYSHREEFREINHSIKVCAQLLRETDDECEPFISTERDRDALLCLIKAAAFNQYLFIADLVGESDDQAEKLADAAVKKYLADTAPSSNE